MRAAVVESGGGLAMAEVGPPAGPRTGWVTVRVSHCGICGSDLHFLGSPLAPPGLIMGHEFSGVVEVVGDGVDSPVAGEHVAVLPAERCGLDDMCRSCEEGATQRCAKQASTSIGIVIPGGFAELVEVPAGSCFGLNARTPLEHASLAEPLAVAVHAIGSSRFSQGMDVAVIGAGPIGALVLLVLKAAGAGKVGVAEPTPARAETAEILGADVVVPRASQLQGAMGESPEIVIECAGRTDTPAEAIGVVRAGGEVVLVGVADPGEMLRISSILWVVKEVAVRGAIAYSTEEFARAVEMIESGEISLDRVISAVRPLESAAESFAELSGPNDQLKVLLTPGE